MIPDARSVIAVVDDDDAVLESIVDLLASAGFLAVTFSSAGEFLSSGLLSSIVCLISDIHMTPVDGWTLRSIALAERPELSIILITGREEVQVGQSADRDTLVLRKPFDAQQLLAAVRSASERTLG